MGGIGITQLDSNVPHYIRLSFLKRKVREYEEIKRQIRELSVEVDGEEVEEIFSENVVEVLNGVS